MPLLLCPNCQTGMREVERNGVHVDVCPQCRGVWLDRGELERLLEPIRQAAAEYDAPPPARGGYAPPPPYPQHHEGYARGHQPYGHKNQPYGHKKKNRWSDILDIFD
ncbi:MAG TPA: zf-TFIIB domain-containing protein [Azospirillum sp.]|nr:zf-TFIIB domain-containing protein [Azospirillum sp.]